MLSNALQQSYKTRKSKIKSRLKDFTKVPESEYFYEIAFCLLTPQSKQIHAEEVIEKLKKRDFQNKKFNPVKYLRDPNHYIRFHNVKSDRLLKLREVYPYLHSEIADKNRDPHELRALLLKHVKGLGWKEASHFLRNIGFRNLTILDRHVLKHLKNLNAIDEIPKTISPKKYLEIEKKFGQFSKKVSIPLDELDLLFWSEETGEVRK